MSKYKIRYDQCPVCKGFGLVKKVGNTPCDICIKYNLTRCIQCENKKLLGLYDECNKCLGRGEVEKKTKSNKNVA